MSSKAKTSSEVDVQILSHKRTHQAKHARIQFTDSLYANQKRVTVDFISGRLGKSSPLGISGSCANVVENLRKIADFIEQNY